MDQKTQRYLQRIEKIMLTPKKHNNQYRPSKSPINCKPHNLDKYLKYQLAATIVQNVVDKNHQLLVTICFNAVRTSDCRRQERIYKFVPVEKSQSLRDMQVDPAISGKFLLSALKGTIRRKYVEFVNALQAAAKAAPIRVKAQRKTSVRQTSGYSMLKRTTTRVEEADYKVVSEWIDGTSNPSATPKHAVQKKQENKKMRQLGLNLFFKIIAGKNKNSTKWALRQMNFKVISSKSNKQIDQAIIKKQQAAKELQEKIYKFASISFIFVRIINRALTQSFNNIRQRPQMKHLRLCSAFSFLQALSKKILVRNQFLTYQHLFTLLKSRLSEYKKNQLQPKSSPRSQRNKVSSSQSSEVEPYNPLARLNFYAFVDKIFRLILIISKLLVPIKEAFLKIDQYASYSYKLQESLKVVPNRYLLDSFEQIKKAALQKSLLLNKQRKQQKPSATAHQFYSIVLTSIHQRLIQGFIHIKIISKERSQKRTRRSSEDSIVETTKKFIIDRQSYNSLSYENWSELKSTLLPPKPSSSKGKYGRNNSNILA